MLQDRLAEGPAIAGVGESRLVRGACHADRLGRHADAATLEAAERDGKALAFVAEQVLGRDLAGIEGDLAMIGRALPHGVLDPHDAIARRRGRHDEGREAALAGRRIGDGKDDGEIGTLAGGDELLAALQHELVADAPGARRDRRRIGAGARFGQAEAAEQRALGEGAQEALLLVRRAVAQQCLADQRIVHLEGRRRGAVGCRDLHDSQYVGHVVGADAAQFGRDGHAQHAELGHLGERLARETGCAVALRGRGRKLAFGKLARHVAHLSLVFGQHAATLEVRCPAGIGKNWRGPH
jgi:hypothetical protein